MPLPLTVWLVHPKEEMCDAFRVRFANLPHVRVVQKRFEELAPHDCFVTAANAFGIMTAGIDWDMVTSRHKAIVFDGAMRVVHKIEAGAPERAPAYPTILDPSV